MLYVVNKHNSEKGNEMRSIKTGNSAINVVFNGKDLYTNKLYAQNITLDNGVLELDYHHEAWAKNGTPGAGEFDKLKLLRGSIHHIYVEDETVIEKLTDEVITKVTLIIDNDTPTTISVSGFDPATGFIQ